MILSFLRGSLDDRNMLARGELYLRPPRMSDWKDWAALRSASRDFLIPWEPTWGSDAVAKAGFRRLYGHLKAMREGETGHGFFIFRESDNALLGGITLSNVRRGVTQTAGLGYWIGAPYARQGIMTEALKAISKFAFLDLELNRLEAACLPHNLASRRLLEKVEFREYGLARQYLRIAGQWQDHVLYEALNTKKKQRRSG